MDIIDVLFHSQGHLNTKLQAISNLSLMEYLGIIKRKILKALF